jgi:alkylated DNA repair dioxygenase AlkB
LIPGAMAGACDSDALEYHPCFLAPDEADDCLARLWRELAWSQQDIVLFGKPRRQPRLTAWYGDPEASYRYSGLSLTPLPWHPLLRSLADRIGERTAARYNAVLANAYRDGRDSMGWHRDDEVELGPNPVIASLSLGQERRFLLREAGQRSHGLDLAHGSLLVMKGDCQRRYQHALPKSRSEMGLRINLTFRLILGAEEWRSQAGGDAWSG